MKQCPFGIKCDDCRFLRSWVLINDRGEQKVEERCGFEVLMDEIPRIRGSIDGCQAASNESRNRVMEYGEASVNTLTALLSAAEKHKLIGSG